MYPTNANNKQVRIANNTQTFSNGKPSETKYKAMAAATYFPKFNIQKTKIMASGPITSWQRDGETMETVRDFILGGLQNHCRW